MKKCLIYARCATTTQTDRENKHVGSLDSQKSDCFDYAKANNYKVLDVFEDIGSGRSSAKRSGLQSLLKACKEQSIDAVLVTRVDRLSRSMEYFRLIEDFKKCGTAVISQAEGNLTDGHNLCVNIFMALRQWEIDRRRSK